MPVNDVIQSKYYHKKGSQIALVVRHWKITFIVGAEPSIVNIRNSLLLSYGPLWAACGTSSASHVGVTAQKIWPLPVADLSGRELVTVGGVAGDPLPNATSGMITLRTGEAGRAKRGRAYIPFLAEADNATGEGPTAGLQTALAALAAEWTASRTVTGGAGSLTLVPVIYSRTAHSTIPITNAAIRDYWGNQRRRAAIWHPDNVLVPVG